MATGMNDDDRDVTTSASVASVCFFAVAVMLAIAKLSGCPTERNE